MSNARKLLLRAVCLGMLGFLAFSVNGFAAAPPDIEQLARVQNDLGNNGLRVITEGVLQIAHAFAERQGIELGKASSLGETEGVKIENEVLTVPSLIKSGNDEIKVTTLHVDTKSLKTDILVDPRPSGRFFMKRDIQFFERVFTPGLEPEEIDEAKEALASGGKSFAEFAADLIDLSPNNKPVLMLSNGNTYWNEWFVIYSNGKLHYTPQDLPRLSADVRDEDFYSSFTVMNDGTVKVLYLKYVIGDDGQVVKIVAKDTNGNLLNKGDDMQGEIKCASFMQHVARNADISTFQDLWEYNYDKIDDINHSFYFPFLYRDVVVRTDDGPKLKKNFGIMFGRLDVYRHREKILAGMRGEPVELGYSKEYLESLGLGEIKGDEFSEDEIRQAVKARGYSDKDFSIDHTRKIVTFYRLIPRRFPHVAIGIKGDGTIVVKVFSAEAEEGKGEADTGVTFKEAAEQLLAEEGVVDVLIKDNGHDAFYRYDGEDVVMTEWQKKRLLKKKVDHDMGAIIFSEEAGENSADAGSLGKRITRLNSMKFGNAELNPKGVAILRDLGRARIMRTKGLIDAADYEKFSEQQRGEIEAATLTGKLKPIFYNGDIPEILSGKALVLPVENCEDALNIVHIRETEKILHISKEDGVAPDKKSREDANSVVFVKQGEVKAGVVTAALLYMQYPDKYRASITFVDGFLRITEALVFDLAQQYIAKQFIARAA